MVVLLLYSTNPFLKYWIYKRHLGDVHYVWCSEQFDSDALSRYDLGAATPATSNPAEIYRDLKQAQSRPDKHNAKINEQKASLIALAVKWESAGIIDQAAKEDIMYLVTNSPMQNWHPLLYVIPRAPIESRLKPVAASERAGLADEFIIPDLARSEFDIIEP